MPDIKMPQLGESVTEGTIGKWLKAVGDSVTKYEPIAEVITDKVTAEVPSDFDGVMEELIVHEGDTVKVGTVICRIATEGDTAGDADAGATAETSGEVSDAPKVTEKPEISQGTAPRAREATASSSGSLPRGRFSPAVLRIAEENGVDLSLVEGTGEGGRITRKDVLAFVSSRPSDQSRNGAEIHSEGSSAPIQSESVSDAAMSSSRADSTRGTVILGAESASSDDEWIDASPIRKTIARRMVESKHNAPHAWTMVESDVTPLVGFRTKVKGDFKRREGIDLTYLPFFIKAVVEAIKRYPIMNASWIDDKIVMHKHINISIAVATDDALVVPVIHDADRLSVAGLAHKVNELAAKARSNRLGMSDVQGGTFTVNNTGAFGSVLSQPIINSPQAAILSVESIVKRPVVLDNDAIAIRSMVNLCLSLDHRILDGWVAGQFLRAVRERLAAFDENTVLY